MLSWLFAISLGPAADSEKKPLVGHNSGMMMGATVPSMIKWEHPPCHAACPAVRRTYQCPVVVQASRVQHHVRPPHRGPAVPLRVHPARTAEASMPKAAPAEQDCPSTPRPLVNSRWDLSLVHKEIGSKIFGWPLIYGRSTQVNLCEKHCLCFSILIFLTGYENTKSFISLSWYSSCKPAKNAFESFSCERRFY